LSGRATRSNSRSATLTSGSTDSLRFIADRAGVFTYRCVLPYDQAKGQCTADHDVMFGHLIVTE